MLVTGVRLRDFRNFEAFDLEPHPSLTVLVGPNAAGKTNAIEAIRLLTAATSFRRPRWEDLVRWGVGAARAELDAAADERRLDVRLDVGADGSRVFTVNGQVRRRTPDVVGHLPSVVFTPDDLDMVKGPSERRRASADELGEQLSPAYGSLRRDYGRAVRQRNALLKDGAADREVSVWSEQVAALGARLLVHRLRLIDRLGARMTSAYASVTGGEELSLSYDDRCGLGGEGGPGLAEEDAAAAIRGELERRAAEERRRLTTLAGPHRDDVVFRIGGRDARAFASQGQQRTVALAWKLAEVSVVRDVLRRDPVLLLDDVMSELDGERRAALSDLVASEVQTFVTTTNIGYFAPAMLERAKVVEVGR